MYIVRPLRKGHTMSATSAFATHPPIAERVRILRGMAGSADFTAYDAAYAKVRGRRVVGLHTLEATRPVAVRAPTGEAADTPHTRARQASDAFLTASGYTFLGCSQCSATIKAPPAHVGRLTTCPRCGGALRPL
jgi:hypothetical protein